MRESRVSCLNDVLMKRQTSTVSQEIRFYKNSCRHCYWTKWTIWSLMFVALADGFSYRPETYDVQNRDWNDTSQVPDSPNITIGFITSFNAAVGSGFGLLVSGAITIAVQDVNRRPDLLPNHTLTFIPGASGKPNSPDAIRKMTEMREQGAVAFIGPDDSCVSEALVAAAWNFPMLTYKCSDSRLSDKTIYSTFARTMPSSSKVSKSLIALLKHYEWNKVTLVVANNSEDIQVKEALEDLAREHGITIISTYLIPGDYLRKYNETIREIISHSYQNTRVYILIAEIWSVMDFARCMHERRILSNGDYVILSFEEQEAYNPEKNHQFTQFEIDVPYDDYYDVTPFQAVLVLAPMAPTNPNFKSFTRQVKWYSCQPPFNIPCHPFLGPEIPIHAGFAYDAVMIYAQALTEVLEEGGSEKNGTAILSKIKSRPYNSILGYSFIIDDNGDAEGNYTLMALKDNPGSQSGKKMMPVGKFAQGKLGGLPVFSLQEDIDWLGGRPPEAEPACGFSGEHCVYKPDWRVIVICSACFCGALIAAIFTFRHYRYEYKLSCLLWKIEMKDVILLRTNSEYTLQNIKNTINLQGYDTSRISSLNEQLPMDEEVMAKKIVYRLGFYKGNVVFIKHIPKKSIDLTRTIRKELIQIREMRHENINPFLGACTDPPAILSLYCARGSLEDILRNDDLDLDNMFIASLVADLIKGMIYLHDSDIVSHGNLKSSNCLVDSRWVLQICDFGLHEFKATQDLLQDQEHKLQRRLLWRAPELLRMIDPPARGTQKGDVYSFGIVLYEIVGRAGPWGPNAPSTKCIIEKVMNPIGEKTYRPPTQDLDCADYVIRCMHECWDEDPEARPDFRFINIKLRDMQSGLKPNIFDNMIAIMEKYAYNLESLVQERTIQLIEEKKKTENLLLRMLPKPVAEQLKRGEPVEAESFDSVTIYFSDIVGFTALSAISTPLQVVDLLNDLYTCFDSIIGHYDVYKVETIGDAYMVVSGLPIRNGDRHAAEIASMALHLLSAIRNFEIRHRPGERLKLRIGIHSGHCVAGVVGLKMPRYCLFGDTVNTASRMESTGEALKIHISEACRNMLVKLGGYVLQERGRIHIKGKGEMQTYWLLGKEGPVQTCQTMPNAVSKESINSSQNNQSPPSDHGDITSSTLGGVFPSLSKNPSPSSTGSPLNCRDVSLLLGSEYLRQPSIHVKKRLSTVSTHDYNSCLSLFQDCRRNVMKDLKMDGKSTHNGYRSAPIISFRDRGAPNFLH